MFKHQSNLKANYARNYHYYGNYEKGFFTPFSAKEASFKEQSAHPVQQGHSTFGDFKHNVKAILMQPIVNIVIALDNLKNATINLIFGLLNVVLGALTFDKDELITGTKNIMNGCENIFNIAYFTISILTDSLNASTRLITHSIGTLIQAFSPGDPPKESSIVVLTQASLKANSAATPYSLASQARQKALPTSPFKQTDKAQAERDLASLKEELFRGARLN